MEAPVDFRHRQTKRSLPPRAFSAKVQQMPLPWQPLEAIPCLLAMRTFLSASRPMAKTVVSAVKPGGQALQALLVGLSYWCFALWVGGAVLYIDNGGCSLERRPFARSVARRSRRGPSAGRPASQSLVPDHLAGVDDAPRHGLLAQSGENSPFVVLACAWCGRSGTAPGPAPGMPS